MTDQSVDLEAQPEDSVGTTTSGVYEMSHRTSEHNGEASSSGNNSPEREVERENRAGLAAYMHPQVQDQEQGSLNSDINDLSGSGDSSISDGTPQPNPSQRPKAIGDFDDSADTLWSLHGKEARRSDEIRIQSLKDDMGGVLIFAGLFSAVLTAFIIDKLRDLRVDPAQQMVYYQQQNVALLAQISQQVSSIVLQVSIPSTPPPPYPDFSPKTSDVRVVAYWFTSLVFSLSAALLATLVPRWLRDYMYVFQQYSSPLKSARLRQYLYEGAQGWYLLVVAESVPVLVHISLFLFFLGLSDELLAQNTTIGTITTIFITICSLLYIFTMFAPVLSPQSPFKNSFSGIIWYLMQKVHPRRYLDHTSGGALKPVSSEMSEAQMQLAMEENDERKRRDMRAIQWLLDTLTEDNEMESFALAIPGSFTTEWGIEVWRKASEVMRYEDANPHSDDPVDGTYPNLHVAVLPRHGSPPPQRISRLRSIFHPLRRVIGIRTANSTLQLASRIHTGGRSPDVPRAYGDLAVHELCKRVRRLFGTCNNRGLFASEDLWRRRARGCVETAASLVCCAGIQLEVFGGIEELLIELSNAEKIRELSAAGSDGSFVTRWTCLSLVFTRGKVNHDEIREFACRAIVELSWFLTEDDPATNRDHDQNALNNARKIDNYFDVARDICLNKLRSVFLSEEGNRSEEEAREVLAGDLGLFIPVLEHMGPVVDSMMDIDGLIFAVSHSIRLVARGLIENLPGVFFEGVHGTELTPPNQLFKRFVSERVTVIPQFIFLRQRLRRLCSYGPKLRDVVERRGDGVYQEMFESLQAMWSRDYDRGLIAYARDLMERQLWRLQDIRDGGGFGFVVELFFLALAQLLSTASSQESHSLYIGTFRAITSDWRQHRHSIGTQRVILNLVCDVAVDSGGIFSVQDYPSYITDELLVLLGHMVEGQSGSHIDDALDQLEHPYSREVRERVFTQGAISILRSQSTTGSSQVE